jgi:hypothetical protein
LRREGGVKGFVANRCSDWLLEGRLKVGFISETQNTLILGGKISQERRIEHQRVVTVVRYVFLIQADSGVMVIEEERLSRLEDWLTLTMNSRGVKQKSRTGRAI